MRSIRPSLLALCVVVTAAVSPTTARADACTETVIAECSAEFPDKGGGLGLSLRGWCFLYGLAACKL